MNASRNGRAWSRVFLRFLFTEVAQEAEDQATADAQLLAAVVQRLVDAIEHHFERDAAVGVGLRVKERFGVDHVLGFAALQVGPGQVVEVLLGTQHIRALVIQVEKLLQVVEGIGTTQGLHIGPGQGDLVALGQGEQQLGLQRAFQVQVQFGLGQGVQPVIHSGASQSGTVAAILQGLAGHCARPGCDPVNHQTKGSPL